MSIIPDFGVLGINARNLLYVRPFNPKKAIKLADDKLKSKHFLSARDIPVPKLYSVIRTHEELQKFDFSSLPSSFVLKPNMGCGGEGIIPIFGRKNGFYEKSSGTLMSQAEFEEHIGDILEGRFSISGAMDTAFFEQRIVCHEALAPFAYKGLPDIRIVVHNLIPVMAMLRLPTKASDGKANLHQGALGVGIDIARGTATHISLKNKIIDAVPEAGAIKGLKIPYWDEILHIASKIQLITNLGYLAVDIVLDKNSGPVLLEVNARAGLGLQIANLAPLKQRLQRIQGIKVNSPEKGVRIAQDIFGNKIEKEVKKISGKQIIGSYEKITLFGEEGSRMVWSSVNTLLERTAIDIALAKEMKLEETEEGSNSFKIKFNIADTRIQTIARAEDLSGKSYDIVLGRRDLKSFLIDPSKNKSIVAKLPKFEVDKPKKISRSPEVNYKEIDVKILDLDNEIKLLYYLNPINFRAEREKFFKDNSYNPQFEYRDFKFDPLKIRSELKMVEDELQDDSALSMLFFRKIKEIEKKLTLLESRGTAHFENASVALFGKPTLALKEQAREKLSQKPKYFQKSKKLSLEQIIFEIEQVFKDYNLEKWRIVLRRDMVAMLTAGKRNTLMMREDVSFSENRLRMVVAHEIETHILTAENGKAQNYSLFARGFANYLQTQEGLAIWNQEKVALFDNSKNYRSALLVFIVDFAMKHSFSETFAYCKNEFGMSDKKAFQTTLKVKRGLENTSLPGAFTKECIYMAGYLQIQNFVIRGGNLKDLYYGKYNLDDLELIKQIPHLREPQHLPRFLNLHI